MNIDAAAILGLGPIIGWLPVVPLTDSLSLHVCCHGEPWPAKQSEAIDWTLSH